MILNKLNKQRVIHPPSWLINSTHYLTQMGSEAYGVSTDLSDIDIYGFCIPPKEIVFPHLAGVIQGFGRKNPAPFNQWQEHHIQPIDGTSKIYDIQVYNIVKYFDLCMDNNPNIIDSLFVPDRCILHITPIGQLLRDNRKTFLHKGSWHKFKGYAYSQLGKIRSKHNAENPKRAESIDKFGYDIKFAYHLIRLINEVEMIMIEHDLDIQRNREQMKSIRRGEWTLEHVEEYFYEKEKNLEKVYAESTLPYEPDEENIKKLLVKCLQMEYGQVYNALEWQEKDDSRVDRMIEEIENVMEKYQ